MHLRFPRISSSLPKFIFLLLAACGRGAEPGPAAAAAPDSPALIPIRDFFRPPFINLPLVNQAGTKFVAIYGTEEDSTGALLFDLATGKHYRWQPLKDHDIDQIHWLDDQRVMWVQSRDELYADAIYVADFSDLASAYAIERKSAVRVIGVPQAAPMKPIVWISQNAYDDGSDYGVVQLDATTTVDPRTSAMNTKRYTSETPVNLHGTEASISKHYPVQKLGRTLDYLVDKHGELAFATAIIDGVERLLLLQKNKWVPSPLDMDRHDVLAAGDLPGEVIAIGPRQEGKPRAILRIDAITGAVTGTLHQDENYDPVVASIKRHPVSRDIVGIQVYRKSLENVWFDPAYLQLQSELNKMFPGKIVSLIGTDKAIQRMVLAVFSDRQPVVYHFLDLVKPELKSIAQSAPWITPAQMRPMQNLAYKSRDGSRVEGFLTLPAGAGKESPAPLVVLLHGGPWARDSWQWHSEAQFLASRGYAVFQPNYRGSTGYSWRFPTGSNWDFQKMHDDVTDGVKQLVKTGLIDPKRMAIMGTSFGGYLSLRGAAYEPDLYRCAITEAGVFDWNLMMKDARRNRFESARYQIYLRNLGDPKESADLFASISPLNHVDKIKAPVLVAHGRDDSVVSIEQSTKLAKELARLGIPHQTLFKRGEGHGMSQLNNQVEFYTAVEDFLAKHLRKTD